MLVLTRRTDESVVVGGSDGITRLLKVTVLEICNGKVKLGFEANDDVPVHRSEVWEQIAAQNWGVDGAALDVNQKVRKRQVARKLHSQN